MRLEGLFRGCNPGDCGTNFTNCTLARITKAVKVDDTDASNFLTERLRGCQNIPAAEGAIRTKYNGHVPGSMSFILREATKLQLPRSR